MSTDETRFFAGEPRPRAAGFQAGMPVPTAAPAPPRPTLFQRLAVGAGLRLLAGLAVAGFCYLQWWLWWQQWWSAWYHRFQSNPPLCFGPIYFLVNASTADDWIGYALLAVVGVCFLTFVAWPRLWSARVVWGLAICWTVMNSPLPVDPDDDARYGTEWTVLLVILACYFLCLSRPAFVTLRRLAGTVVAVWVFASVAATSAHPVTILEALVLAVAAVFLFQLDVPARQPGATRANFARVRIGMSDAEVELILGPPGDYTTGPPAGPDYPPGGAATHQRIWRTDEGLFWVEFNCVDDWLTVKSTRFWPAGARVEPVKPPGSS
jgi:hypothetical protein